MDECKDALRRLAAITARWVSAQESTAIDLSEEDWIELRAALADAQKVINDNSA
jgi:hypothetical protein